VELTIIGTLLTALGTFAGIWGIGLLFRWFQHDFVNVLRHDIDIERRRADEAEALADVERKARIKWQLYAAKCQRALVHNGLEVPVKDDHE